VAKASSGALDLFPSLYVTNNLARFLTGSQEFGWKVYGTELRRASSKFDEDTSGPGSILVMGNEGKGVRKAISKICNRHVIIPGGDEYVDSLNVSVATGILLAQMVSK
jgi:tRNA G18 (ribose-2'-O)-methylase SpoU